MNRESGKIVEVSWMFSFLRPYGLVRVRNSWQANRSLPVCFEIFLLSNKYMSLIIMVKILSTERLFLECQQHTVSGTNTRCLNMACISFTLACILFVQVKHFRALQEQARTYLDLLCSMCDLSNSSVKTTAKDIQQTEQMVKKKKFKSCWICLFYYILQRECWMWKKKKNLFGLFLL